MATLTLERVSKIYRQRRRQPVQAVINVSMAIQDGEIVGLLGSSGCGKTSTLRMIAGFEEVSQGVIRLGDRVLQPVVLSLEGRRALVEQQPEHAGRLVHAREADTCARERNAINRVIGRVPRGAKAEGRAGR